MVKRKVARALKSALHDKEKTENVVVLPPVISSDEPPAKRTKWINKHRVLVFSTRGILAQARHLMNDMKRLMPHSKREPKMDHKDDFRIVNEICEIRNCNKCIFFEARKKKDLYMWISNVSEGPSAKFLVENVHTMCELKLTGNCLQGSRPLLSFDEKFDKEPHWQIFKRAFHPDFWNSKSSSQKPAFHRSCLLVLHFGQSYLAQRFVLNPVRIFEGSLGGPTLYVNPYYRSPNEYRQLLRKKYATKYISHVNAKIGREERKLKESYLLDETNDVFVTIRPGDVEES